MCGEEGICDLPKFQMLLTKVYDKLKKGYARPAYIMVPPDGARKKGRVALVQLYDYDRP